MREFIILVLAFAVSSSSFHVYGAGLDEIVLAIQQAMQNGDLDGAARLTDASIKEHPNEGGLYNLRGVIHARRNELPQAHQDFQKAVQFAPGLTPAWQNLARVCRLEDGLTPSTRSCAFTATRRLLQLDPHDDEARAAMALLEATEGRSALALQNIRELSPQAAAQPANRMLRCAVLAALGRTSEAAEISTRIIQAEQFSEPDFSTVAPAFNSKRSAPVLVALLSNLDRRQSLSVDGLKKLVIAYEQDGQPAEARKTLERVALADPKNPSHLLELARLAEAAKDHEAALGYLGHARDLTPDNPQIHFLIAMIAMELDLPVEARRSLDRALSLDPASPAYNYAMGTVILTTRDAATAGSYFRKFLASRPQDPKGRYALGVADFASGDYGGSKKEMLAVENNPKVAGGAAYFLGRIARRENDLEAAARYLHQAIRLMPDYAESYTELARVHMQQENLEEAHKELDIALEKDPRSFQANTQLLVLYKRQHDPRAEKQSALVKELDQDRSRRAELMLRTVELRP